MNNDVVRSFYQSLSPVVQATVDDFGQLLEEVLDYSSPDERGNWYYRGDTGTGKTSAIRYWVANATLARFVIAVPTQHAADQMYLGLKALGADVAVWTSAHDAKSPVKADFTPSARFFKERLSQHRVLVGTHQFLLSGGPNVGSLVGPRDLLIVDEVPLHFEGADALQFTDFARAWEEANALNVPAMYPLRRVHLWAQSVSEAAEGRPQYLKAELCEREEEWRQIAATLKDLDATGDGRAAIRRVVSFVLATFEGRAFVQTRDSGGHYRVVFCTTSMALPTVNRVIHVSATVHLEGWQVSPYVDRVRTSRGQQLNYSRLSVIADAWPKDLPSNYAMLLQSPQSIAAFKEAVTDAVLKTPEDSKVLLVVPAKLQQHAEAALKCPTLDFLDRALDVRITHFKVDIGSNDYADCTDVILFGLHHAPKTAHLQRGLQFSQMRVSQEMLDDQQGSLTKRSVPTTTRRRSSSWGRGGVSVWHPLMGPVGRCGCGPIRVRSPPKRSKRYSLGLVWRSSLGPFAAVMVSGTTAKIWLKVSLVVFSHCALGPTRSP